ncbi:Peptidoglycan O-acetyltransferase [Stieleria maiorica]|uniref:Peptidoglycan O-acetyltransferase n=1 Tax=Stieleria maiorica TaxID=2795974 RepID=A0A5B9MIP0_9BACT|nr:MBOAT family protein [Stieleria maiorica]QEF99485.1 Peptidoglycan O-acetyltransferase [Stieleria maiorica]
MLFNSFDFFGFFVVVFLVQLVLPHRARNLFLLATSYFFYACWDWRFVGLMAASTVIDYVCSHKIHRSETTAWKRRFLSISLIANLSILGFFKYAGFFVDSWIALAASQGIELSTRTWNIILPVGISFYTFQTMSYTWDVYRGEMRPLKRFSDFALYVAFFPQLVAGPIERGKHLSPQIESGPRTSWQGVRSGVWMVTKGLFKKAVIADNLAPIVADSFGSESPHSLQVLIGVYAFAFQIYGDFSGYTDIARGVARMMGYALSLNFRLPYFATNPSEFWKRWHVSLSSFLRDYLYIPLGGNRAGTLRTYRNLLVTMLLGGLWHGAAWNFVIWGFYHGVLLILYERLSRTVRVSDAWLNRIYPIRLMVMFHLTCVGWLIFRAESTIELQTLFAGLFHYRPVSLEDCQAAWKLVLLAGPLLVLQAAKEYTKCLNFVPNLSPVPRLAICAGCVVAILTLGSFGKQEFIYFQF